MITVSRTGHGYRPNQLSFSMLMRIPPLKRSKGVRDLADILVVGLEPSQRRIQEYKEAGKIIINDEAFCDWCLHEFPECFL